MTTPIQIDGISHWPDGTKATLSGTEVGTLKFLTLSPNRVVVSLLKTLFVLMLNLSGIHIASAEDEVLSLRQQLGDAIASGRKMEFGNSQSKTAILFVGFSDDAKQPKVQPLYCRVAINLLRREGEKESIDECRDRISRWCSLCRKNDLRPPIRIWIHYEHDESLLKDLLNIIADENVQEVQVYIETKEDVFRNHKVELPLPRPLPTPPSKRGCKKPTQAGSSNGG